MTKKVLQASSKKHRDAWYRTWQSDQHVFQGTLILRREIISNTAWYQSYWCNFPNLGSSVLKGQFCHPLQSPVNTANAVSPVSTPAIRWALWSWVKLRSTHWDDWGHVVVTCSEENYPPQPHSRSLQTTLVFTDTQPPAMGSQTPITDIKLDQAWHLNYT